MSIGPVSWTTTHGDKVTVRQRWWFSAHRRDAAHWQWYWQRMAGNGSILCHSEGYVKRVHCLRMAERINPKVETLPKASDCLCLRYPGEIDGCDSEQCANGGLVDSDVA